MDASLTELRRKAGKVTLALRTQKSVRLTEHGRVIADLNPRTQPISGAEFAKLWRKRRPLDKATAEEILKNIRETRKADALSR